MTRNLNLILAVLDSITSKNDIKGPEDLTRLGAPLHHFEPADVQYHLRLLVKAGFVGAPKGCFELTWTGCDLFDELCNGEIEQAAAPQPSLPDGVMSATEIVDGKSYVISVSPDMAGQSSMQSFSDMLEAQFPESKFIFLGPDAVLHDVIGEPKC